MADFSYLEFGLLALIAYYVVYVLLWLVLDCNVALWYKTHFGLPVSALRGQVVWITGASSGIGRGLALSLASGGVRLVLSARRLDLLKDVKAECLAASHGLLTEHDVLVLPMDLLQLSEHQRLLNTVVAHFGQLDVLVNNAGRSQRAAWLDIEVDVDREIFELDVFAVVHLTRVVVRYFNGERAGRGQVAVTSSVAGFAIAPFSASYCAAKHALNAYYRTLKVEHPALDVSIFCPGPVSTDFLRVSFTAKRGEVVGGSTANQKRVTPSRCGQLFAVTLANKLDFTWCGLFPVNFLAYCSRNPTLTKLAGLLMSRHVLNKIREGKL